MHMKDLVCIFSDKSESMKIKTKIFEILELLTISFAAKINY